MNAATTTKSARHEEIYTETVLVTPEIAKQWLTLNKINRPISQETVKGLAWDITHGKWQLTHQGIAFNRDLDLIDGQHRLTAVVAAGRAVPMRVSYNIDGDYSAPIDTGRSRTAAHVLRLSPRVVAVCNGLALLESGRPERGSAAKVADVYKKHQRGVDWALEALPLQRRITANIVAAHAFAFPVAPDQVAGFARQLATFQADAEDSPVVALRRHIERLGSFASSARLDLTLVTLRCLHAHCRGERLQRAHANDIGLAYFARRRAEMGL
jgi:hypothetical protein